MRTYKCLNKQVFESGEYKLVPIRHEDRYAIMQWRNEQIYHLRQSEPLTNEKQDWYFENVVASLFDQEKPDQILFSFLKGDECIGYGGLVHINWLDRNAEISFVIKTNLQESSYQQMWWYFLNGIKQVAFKELDLRKIFTYAFDVRPQLYQVLNSAGFLEEARLKEHCIVEDNYKDVLIHSFWNPLINITMRLAEENDIEILFNWANDSDVRANSFSPRVIEFDSHKDWFKSKLISSNSRIYIFEGLNIPFGQVRLDLSDSQWVIDYSIDKNFRGLGLGKIIIQKVIKINEYKIFKAIVKKTNTQSIKVFERLGFRHKKSDHLNSEVDHLEFIYER